MEPVKKSELGAVLKKLGHRWFVVRDAKDDRGPTLPDDARADREGQRAARERDTCGAAHSLLRALSHWERECVVAVR
jgi:hypothetical protein